MTARPVPKWRQPGSVRIALAAAAAVISVAGCQVPPPPPPAVAYRTPTPEEVREAARVAEAQKAADMARSGYVPPAERQRKAANGHLPKDYKAQVESYFKGQAIDPDSIKLEFTSTPAPGVSCGAVNGKNRFGGYTGRHPFAANFNESGHLERAVETDPSNLHLYQDRRLGLSESDEAALLRICGFI
jgi:hypothetical protein